MKFINQLGKMKLITLGTKIMFGVALVTNILIGILIYVNFQASSTIENTVNELLVIQENLNENLRDTVVKLQNEYLELPDFFTINHQAAIIEKIKQQYKITDTLEFHDRSSYKSFFTRKQRRDLSKGKIIIHSHQSQVIVSYGELDEAQNFSGKVLQLLFNADDPEATAKTINQMIVRTSTEESGEQALLKKISTLNSLVAEAGLQAEETRIEILQQVENITIMKEKLAEVRMQHKEDMIYMSVLVIIMNMLILFFLIRRIVERPLSHITNLIDEIQRGNTPEIPVLKRRDQIGTLSEATSKFRQALIDIREENIRKVEEKQIIDDVVHSTTTMIGDIESRAQKLAEMSESLQNLAETAGGQAEKVSINAEETAENTDQVSQSATQLNDVMNEINDQITHQGNLVADIVDNNSTSQVHMKRLDQAVKEIDGIITLVRDITEQTQLLALNATIEAARAGQAGKGFAVVATEMKELSMKTQRAASDVMHKVSAINQAGVTLTQNFNDIESHLLRLNEVTANISDGVSTQHTEVITITQLAARTSNNTHDVSLSIRAVNEAAGKTSDLSSQVSNYADEIANQLSILLSETTTKLQQMRDDCVEDPQEQHIAMTSAEEVSPPSRQKISTLTNSSYSSLLMKSKGLAPAN